MASQFLFLHGLDGSGPGHWQHWLADRLRTAGERVLFPELPQNDDPDPAVWEDELERELASLNGGERVVIAHSLGCLLWLRTASRSTATRADRVLLAAPPATETVDAVVRFARFDASADSVRRACPDTRIVCSDDDPYNPRGAVATHAEPLGLPVEVIPGGGHLNVEAGFGPWPDVERWALTRAPG
jgi:serine hydrolase